MNVIGYHPQNPENIDTLHKRAAVVHADAVIRYIKQLPCSKEQKIALLTRIKKESTN